VAEATTAEPEEGSSGGGHRLDELAAAIGATVEGDGARTVGAVRTLEDAGPGDVAPFTDAAYRAAAEASRAGALLVPADRSRLVAGLPPRPLLVAPRPSLALARLLEILHPETPPASGVHPTAVVGRGCRLGDGVHVGPYAVIEDGAVVGEGAVVEAHAVVGRGAEVGAGARLHPHVVLYPRSVVGARSVVHAGVVVGSDGFGYVPEGGVHRKIPQVGRAVLGEDVEVGANSAVDRGTLGDTTVGPGSKIDNLVQVAHNVRTGRGVVLCGQAGIAGSAVLGDHVVLGGQAGVSDHRRLGDRVQVAAKSAVLSDVPADTTVAGIPAGDAAAWRRRTAVARRLEGMWRRLRALERRLGAADGDDDAAVHENEDEEES
jgi:UDP-3-O-[3-hydroxymyristoyl] glucosamine N-acyltransferase